MSEKIEFDNSIPLKDAPVIPDTKEKEIREKAIAGIEKQQIITQEKIKAGVIEPENVDVPKEFPMLAFHYGSVALQCPAFELDPEEQKVMAKHLTVIASKFIKASWIWSVIVIVIITVGKVVQCSAAVKKFLHREKKPEEQQKTTEEKEHKITETL